MNVYGLLWLMRSILFKVMWGAEFGWKIETLKPRKQGKLRSEGT